MSLKFTPFLFLFILVFSACRDKFVFPDLKILEVRHITSKTALPIGISEGENKHVFKQLWYSTSPDVSKQPT